MTYKTIIMRYLGALLLAVTAANFAYAADGVPDIEDGKYVNADGDPVYYKSKDDVWDWYTFNGNRRYHGECHVCHGPFGKGSSFAPDLSDSLKTMTYEKFQETVINGQRNIFRPQNSVMPAFGVNKNVYCFLDDLYLYLRARSEGKLDFTLSRDMKKEKRPQESRDYQDECFGDG